MQGENTMAEGKEKLDFLTKLRVRELVLMGLITITAVMANLPHEYVEETLGVSHNTLLEHGYTPLAYAAMKGNPPMIELLLRNGANPALVSKEGDTPVELALRMGHNEVADLLKKARREAEAPAAGAADQPATQAG